MAVFVETGAPQEVVIGTGLGLASAQSGSWSAAMSSVEEFWQWHVVANANKQKRVIDDILNAKMIFLKICLS
jgi:hypothetical protein